MWTAPSAGRAIHQLLIWMWAGLARQGKIAHGGGCISPLFNPPPRLRGGGALLLGRFGASQSAWDSMESKHQKRNENGIFEISASRGVSKALTPFEKKTFLPQKGEQAPGRRGPFF